MRQTSMDTMQKAKTTMHSNTIYDAHSGQYLVYVLYRDGNLPHYVGATSNPKRPYGNHHHARTDYNVTSVEIVQEDLSREDASILEDQLINQYGRQVEGGTLINIQGGGHGLTPHSEETNAKISAATKGRPKSEETKRKMSLAHKGKPLSDEHRAKIKESWARRKAAALK